MKKVVKLSLLLLTAISIFSFTFSTDSLEKSADKIKWYTFEEAVALNEKAPKKMYIDVYTDWCHWCKVMDKKTFTDPKVAAYMNENFYPVKLNAEQKEVIKFQGKDFEWVEAGRRGIHMLAYSLLEGKASYPSFVYLNEKYERIMTSPGFKEPAQLMPELKFAAEEHYKTTSWQEYQAKN